MASAWNPAPRRAAPPRAMHYGDRAWSPVEQHRRAARGARGAPWVQVDGVEAAHTCNRGTHTAFIFRLHSSVERSHKSELGEDVKRPRYSVSRQARVAREPQTRQALTRGPGSEFVISGLRGEEGGGHCQETRSAGVNGVWRERGDAGRCLPLIMASAAQNRWRTSTSDEEQLFATPQTGSPRVTLATLPRPLRPPPAPRSVPPPGQAMAGSGPEAC